MQRRMKSPKREVQEIEQNPEDRDRNLVACGKVFHGYLERRKTLPARRDTPSKRRECVFKNGMKAISTIMLTDANQ